MIKGIQIEASTHLSNTRAQQGQPDLFTKLMNLIRQTTSGRSVKSGELNLQPADSGNMKALTAQFVKQHSHLRERNADMASNPSTSLFLQTLQTVEGNSSKEKQLKDQSLFFLLLAGNAPPTQPEKIIALFTGKETASKPSKATLMEQGNAGLSFATTSTKKKTDTANPSTKAPHTDQKTFTKTGLSDNANAILDMQTNSSGKARPAIKAAQQAPNQNQAGDLQSTPTRLSGNVNAILDMQTNSSGKARPAIKAAQQAPNQNQAGDLQSTPTHLSGNANVILDMQTNSSGKAQPAIKVAQQAPNQNQAGDLQSTPTIENSLMRMIYKSGRISSKTSKSGKAGITGRHAQPIGKVQISGNNLPQQPVSQTMQEMAGKNISDNLITKNESLNVSNEASLQTGNQAVNNGSQAQQTGLNPQSIAKQVEKTVFTTDQHRTWPATEAMREIAREAGNGRTRLEIRLDPPQLGKIRVALESDANKQIQVHFLVDQVQSRQIIEQQLPILKQALEQQGLSMGDFSMQGGRQQEKSFSNQSSSTAGTGTESTPANTEISAIQIASNTPVSHGSGNLNIHI